ncbi:MAG TPA: phosphoadenosine phosphosulfate reductase family protein, partial [Methanomassiliicoccales archaeon]|nr:phosphoadenosine phosphosulfate reductase family protein [Methanomassiliicoccales archaeon]
MGIVRLGKMHLRWCHGCNVPVLEDRTCGKCGAETKQMDITPPGDARPGFAHDIHFIRELIDVQFGPGAGLKVLPENKIILLSKVPGIDRMEEVIADGEVLGTLRYDLGGGWKFVMRVPAAIRLQGAMGKGMVIADDGAVKPILGSNNLMAPGVVEAFEGIEKGDEIVILDRNLRALATGTAKMDSAEMMIRGKGVAVKVRWANPPKDFHPSPAGQDWDHAIKANVKVMERTVNEAIGFIRDVTYKNKLPAIVSFSGGKDSLACLLLTMDANMKLPALFIDTGLEFPETVEYVEQVRDHYGLELIVEKAPDDAFYGNLEYFGPPGRDFRWCCKTNKLGPTVKAIMHHFPNGVLSFIGQRRYESEQRAEKPRVWKNPWTPGQIGASPIQNWTSLHIWLYIFMRKAPYNPWYEKGLDRIGCYLCPASDLAELQMVAEKSPALRTWNTYLNEYSGRRGYPEKWAQLGLWRWRRLPPSIIEELGRNGIAADEIKRRDTAFDNETDKKLVLRMQEGYSPCVMGFSIEGAFSRSLDFEQVANLLNMLDKVDINRDEGWCSITSITLFQEGALIGKGKEQERIKEKIEAVRRIVVKAEECVGCGV